MLIIFFSAAIIVISGVLLWNAYKEYGDGFKYFEQGIVITLAVGGGCVSLVSALIQNRKSIDADIKAKSRIEWIQRVREATAEFITACYCILRLGGEYNQKKMNEVFPDIQKTGLLLILFFGPDKSGENEEITDKINDILLSIEKITFEGYKENIEKQIDDSKRQIDEKYDDLINNHGISEDELNSHFGFEKAKSSEKKELIDSYKKLLSSYNNSAIKLQNEYFEFIKTLNDDLHDLSGIIREYLKKEWDRAKDNKD